MLRLWYVCAPCMCLCTTTTCHGSSGPDITKAFLERNRLQLVVRSHEVVMGGYEIMHDGNLVTVFSAPNYCGKVRVEVIPQSVSCLVALRLSLTYVVHTMCVQTPIFAR